MLLEKYLHENEVSQNEFARLLTAEMGREVTQGAVSRLVARIYQPSLPVVLAIGKLTGGEVTPADLLPLRPARRNGGKKRRPRAS